MSIDCNNVKEWAAQLSLVEACDPVGDGYLRLLTPFRYPNGSQVDLFLKETTPLHGGWTLSDIGQSAGVLFDLGLRVTTQKRRQIVADVCEALGVRREGGALQIELSRAELETDLSPAMFRLGQACIRVSDLAFTQQFRAPSLFKDDVEEFISVDGIEVERDVVLEGQFGKEVTLDFRTGGEHVRSLIQTLATASGFATHPVSTETFRRWYDLMPQRDAYQFVTIYDSERSKFKDDDLARLDQTSTLLAFPAQQEQILEVLAA